MDAELARLAWGLLAGLAGAASSIGAATSARAWLLAWRRRGLGGALGARVNRRDLAMLGALAVASALTLAVSVGLVALLPAYGPDLDAVLARLAVPILLLYAGFAVAVAIVSTVAPIWLIARWRTLDRAVDLIATRGHDGGR